MKIPFQIMLPKFKIENRDIYLSFSTMIRAGDPKVTVVIDYFEITDHKGRIIRDTSIGTNGVITTSQHGRKINLAMKGAGFKISYDCLDICVHFLTQDGKSIAAHYEYRIIGNKFLYSRSEINKMTEDEEDIMFDILIKANNAIPVDSHSSYKENNSNTQKENSTNFDELNIFTKAIEQEMIFLRNSGGKRYKITNGQFVMQSQGEFIYSFDLDAELFIAEDSPVTVHVGLDKISGTVLLCENFQIIIALEKIPFSDKTLKIPKAEISAEPWKLLERLDGRLRSINNSNKIVKDLLIEGPKLASSRTLSSIACGQEIAISHAALSPITVIWGPPGTGKTHTMAQIAQHFLTQGKNILIVSHSNVSVDNVAKQIYNQIKDGELSPLLLQSKILRYGYVRDEELQKNEFVSSFKVALRNSPDKNKLEKLQDEYKHLNHEAEVSNDTEVHKDILRINQAIKVIKAKYKETEKKLVSDARLVATTVSKIYSDALFEGKSYDVVMFDEVSMAYVPQIVAAASFATDRLICVGDFRQLSPIVQEKNAKVVLGKDIFEYLNISKGLHDINYHPWLVMLDEQRRMHPAISAFPSKFIYNGLLKDHPSTIQSREAIAKSAPFNHPMCMIDLYGTACFGSKNEDNSRFNILSAVFSFATALKSEKHQLVLNDASTDEEKVGIITPYAAQTRLIKAMIQDYRQSKRITNISCATVHQFQGSERNVVIFDAVESCPSTRAGWLMSKNEGGAVTRLINVALTRSRGKFIAIANKPFWTNKFGSENMFSSLVRYMSTSSHILNYQNNALAEYIQSTNFGSTIKIYTATFMCNCDLLDDIRTAQNKIMIMIPKGQMNTDYAEMILGEIYKRTKNNVSVAIIYDKSVTVSSAYQDFAIPSDKVTMPLLFIDNKAWYGLPIYKYDCLDSQLRYPILSDIIVRFSGKCTVEMIKSLVEHANVKPPIATGLALYVKNHYSCDKCDEPLTLVKSNKHFLKCKKCGNTQFLTTTMLNNYLDTTRGKCYCGKDLFAVNGRYGIYVKCVNNHITKLDEI